MTAPAQPLIHLKDCGCCEGLGVKTPVTIVNRPGLSAIAYRAGTQTQFKASMIAQLSGSGIPELRKLRTRADDDFTIALLDSWAMVCDVLAFYQERIANESYLLTATERASLINLARLIGYQLRPGVAASTYLAFTLETGVGSPETVTIDTRTKVQSIPGPGEKPQTFETVESVGARGEWNDLRPRLTELKLPKRGDKSLYLQGTDLGLKVGDGVLLVGDERKRSTSNENWDFRLIESVTTDSDSGRTLITWNEGLGTKSAKGTEPARENPKAYGLRKRAAVFGYNALDWRLLPDVSKKSYLGLADTDTLTPAQRLEWPDFVIFTPTGTSTVTMRTQPKITDATAEQVAAAATAAANKHISDAANEVSAKAAASANSAAAAAQAAVDTAAKVTEAVAELAAKTASAVSDVTGQLIASKLEEIQQLDRSPAEAAVKRALFATGAAIDARHQQIVKIIEGLGTPQEVITAVLAAAKDALLQVSVTLPSPADKTEQVVTEIIKLIENPPPDLPDNLSLSVASLIAPDPAKVQARDEVTKTPLYDGEGNAVMVAGPPPSLEEVANRVLKRVKGLINYRKTNLISQFAPALAEPTLLRALPSLLSVITDQINQSANAARDAARAALGSLQPNEIENAAQKLFETARGPVTHAADTLNAANDLIRATTDFAATKLADAQTEVQAAANRIASTAIDTAMTVNPAAEMNRLGNAVKAFADDTAEAARAAGAALAVTRSAALVNEAVQFALATEPPPKLNMTKVEFITEAARVAGRVGVALIEEHVDDAMAIMGASIFSAVTIGPQYAVLGALTGGAAAMPMVAFVDEQFKPAALEKTRRLETDVNAAVAKANQPVSIAGEERKSVTTFSEDTIDLDTVYSKITKGSWAVLAIPSYNELYQITDVKEASRAQFSLTGKTSRIKLSGENLKKIFEKEVRATTVFAESEELPIAETPLGIVLSGDEIVLDRLITPLLKDRVIVVTGHRARVRVEKTAQPLSLVSSTDSKLTKKLEVGDELIITSPWEDTGDQVFRWHLVDLGGFEGYAEAPQRAFTWIAADKNDEPVSEIAVIKSTVAVDETHSKLTLQAALSNVFDRSTVTINANVGLATHGETVADEVLGSGDAGQPYQRFTLRNAPLTYTSADTPSGGESTLEVRVNDLKWEEVPSLFGHGPREHIYITQIDDDQKATVEFGDGITGARLPMGRENVKATYRKGIGLEGLVKAGQLSLLMTRPLGVKGVINPTPATGAQDPQSLSDARTNSPLTVLTLDRIVSLIDYEDFARTFSGIAKALATWTWNLHTRGVFITVAGVDGAAVDQKLHDTLLAAALNVSDARVPVTIKTYQPVTFKLAADVKVDPVYRQEAVMAAIETSLRSDFSFAARTFGQPVTLSEVISSIQNVPGVIAVDVNNLFRSDQSPSWNALLPAAAPRSGDDSSVPAAELLTLDPKPLALGIMP